MTGVPDATSGGYFAPYWEPGAGWVRTSEITFAQHRQIFGNDLVVTGTNLETTKSHFFSAATTPRFPVVDATRISMSIPYLFKPMRIKDGRRPQEGDRTGGEPADHHLKGVWADGGLLNNMPVTAFDIAAGGPGHTLGLMVGVEGRTEISSLTSFLNAYVSGFLGGTGDSQLSATTSNVDRVIVLDTQDRRSGKTISMLDFKLDQALYDSINKQSKETVEEFFATRVGP